MIKNIKNIITLITLLLYSNIILSSNIYQEPDSTQNNDSFESFSPFKEKLIIETENSNDTATEKLIKKKQSQRALQYTKPKIINRWDTLEFSDINIDSIKFIFSKNIYNQEFLINFLYQIPDFKPTKPKEQTKPKNTIQKTTSIVKKISDTKKTKIIKLKESKPFPNEWSFIIIILSLIILLIIRFYKPVFIKNIFLSLINYQTSLNLYKENNSLSIKINFISVILFLINISFFITLSINKFNISFFDLNGILLFTSIFILITSFYLFKFISFLILGYIFNILKEVREYYFSNFIFNKVLGIILIPINVFLPFLKTNNVIILYKFIFFTIIILFIWKLLHSFFAAFRLKLSIYYLILYLCALEILPAIALVKFLLS